jgi:hypothetical protein
VGQKAGRQRRREVREQLNADERQRKFVPSLPRQPRKGVHNEEGEADSLTQVRPGHLSLVKRVHNKEGEADSLAQVRPSNLVDREEWEANYHDQKLQLNKQRVGDHQVWGKKLDADADEKRGHDEEG